jgi:hypothetical protein
LCAGNNIFFYCIADIDKKRRRNLIQQRRQNRRNPKERKKERTCQERQQQYNKVDFDSDNRIRDSKRSNKSTLPVAQVFHAPGPGVIRE